MTRRVQAVPVVRVGSTVMPATSGWIQAIPTARVAAVSADRSEREEDG
ncbi:MAG: hypothetical protein OSB36_07850 [Longimicrobiales bacterium]|nr:hypothetical protein [Longimicrobiales bacterium]